MRLHSINGKRANEGLSRKQYVCTTCVGYDLGVLANYINELCQISDNSDKIIEPFEIAWTLSFLRIRYGKTTPKFKF
jgi:hypothetical protein